MHTTPIIQWLAKRVLSFADYRVQSRRAITDTARQEATRIAGLCSEHGACSLSEMSNVVGAARLQYGCAYPLGNVVVAKIHLALGVAR